MARTNNLTNFLTDVASAIKEKKGDEEHAIPAAEFDTEIINLPSQGVYQDKEVTISQNGVMTYTPDTGYDAFERIKVTTNVPGIDTSDATATVDDILYDKTAYITNGKVTGGIIPSYNTTEEITDLNNIITLSNISGTIYDINTKFGLILTYVSKETYAFNFNLYTFDSEGIKKTTPLKLTTGLNTVKMVDAKFALYNDPNYWYIFIADTESNDKTALYNLKINKTNYTYTQNGTEESGYYYQNTEIKSGRIFAHPTRLSFAYINTGYFNRTYYSMAHYAKVLPNGLISKANNGLSGESWVQIGNSTIINGGWSSDGLYLRFCWTGDQTRWAMFKITDDDTRTKIISNTTTNYKHPLPGGYLFDGNGIYEYTNPNTIISTDVPTDSYFYANTVLYLGNKIIYISGLNIYVYKFNEEDLKIELFYRTTLASPNNYTYFLDPNVCLSFYNSTSRSICAFLYNDVGILNQLKRQNTYFGNNSLNVLSPNDVRAGKYFTNYAGAQIGSMTDNGELEYTPTTSTQLIPEGYTSGGIINPAIMGEEDYNTCIDLADYIMYGGDLPLPYVELEYIQSTGTQYIDTEVNTYANYNTYRYLLDIQLVSKSAGTYSIMGTGNFYAGFKNTDDTIVFAPNGETKSTTISLDYNRHTFTIDAPTKKYSYDTQENTFEYNSTYADRTATMYLFAWQNNAAQGVPQDCFACKLYNCKFYINNDLVRDFIPVKRKSDNVICLYDKVSKQFFLNQGTGNFIAGPEKEVI